MTNEQKHEMFKREISASIIESASWNDRQMEEYKTITMYEFWYDYINDGLQIKYYKEKRSINSTLLIPLYDLNIPRMYIHHLHQYFVQ